MSTGMSPSLMIMPMTMTLLKMQRTILLKMPCTPRDQAEVIRHHAVSVGDLILGDNIKALTETDTTKWETLVHVATATLRATCYSDVPMHLHTGKRIGVVTEDSTEAHVMIVAVEHAVQEATLNFDMRLHNQLKVVML